MTTRHALRLAVPQRALAVAPEWIVRLCLMPCILSILSAAPAVEPSFWDLTPYRVRVLVAVASVPELQETMEADVATALAESANRVLGGRWNLEIRPVSGALRDSIVRRIDTLPNDLFSADWNKLDKGVALGIDVTAGGFRLVTREFDCRTRLWSASEVHLVRQTSLLPTAAFRALLATFAPLARIEFNEQGQPILHPRAAGLPVADPSFHSIRPDDVFLPVMRFNDHDGNPRKDGIHVVPWTFLSVGRRGPAGIVCTLQSGFRHPLRVRLRGRIEQLALAIRSPRGPTRLLLRERAHPDRPLIGYEILARDPGASTTRSLGRTDCTGTIMVAPGKSPLRILYVRNGVQLLARLPLVPGWKPAVTARISDDTARVRAEGFLAGLEADLLDVVARRDILLARIRYLMKKGKLTAAQEPMDQLQQLPNRQHFLQQVAQEQQRDVSSDPRIQARIERRFAATKRLLVEYLDPRKINSLQLEFDRLRQKTTR